MQRSIPVILIMLLASMWWAANASIALGQMTQIPGGTFQMGDSFGEGDQAESPVHTVTLDSFYIGSTEITNGQYRDFLNSAAVKVVSGYIVYAAVDDANSYPYIYVKTDINSNSPSHITYNDGVFSVKTKGGRDMSDDPVVTVSWYGAAAYCNWRSQQEGHESCYDTTDPNWPCDFSKYGYRLPTEAEWEYAARGGLSGKRFPWGDTISHSQANYYSSQEYVYDVSPTADYHPAYDDGIFPYTAPVGSFAANGYGLYDMAGNVWEWCNDWADFYSDDPATNPTGPETGASRIFRGGGWYRYENAYRSRVASRASDWAGYKYLTIGFRVVIPAAHHPADTNLDWCLSISEVTSYGACWRSGCTWSVEPSDIPIGYVTRAGYLWRGGECYQYDAGYDPPLCWDLAGSGGEPLAMAGGDFDGFNIEYVAGAKPAGGIQVNIAVFPDPDTKVYAVEDSPPAGWSVSDINNSGVWDSANKKVKWGIFFGSDTRVFSYTTAPPAGSDPYGPCAGTVSFDGVDQNFTHGVSALEGDLSGDGLVNMVDFSMLAGTWIDGPILLHDLDNSGQSDRNDLAIFVDNWLNEI